MTQERDNDADMLYEGGGQKCHPQINQLLWSFLLKIGELKAPSKNENNGHEKKWLEKMGVCKYKKSIWLVFVPQNIP